MVFTYLTLIASYLALFFAIFKIVKKNKHVSDYYLIIWLLVLSVLSFCKLDNSLFVATSGRLLSVSYGIILFLYIKNVTLNSGFKSKDLLHFIPFIVALLPVFFVDLYVYSSLYDVLNLLIFVTYLLLSVLLLRKYKNRIKDGYLYVERANMLLLNIMIYGSVFFAAIPIIELLYSGYPAESVGSVLLFIFVNIIGLKGGFDMDFIKQPQENDNVPGERKIAYSNYGLKSTDAEKLSERLGEYMKKERPYLNQSLTLKDLAKAMDTYPHYITQVLSTVFNQNFYDFVNEYRVEEAERQLTAPSKAKFTILSIAYDCGFNSKATFNRVFKEKKGVTPTEYKLAIQ